VSGKHRKTLSAVFADPVSGSIKFADIEAMLVSLGGTVTEGAGSRVRFDLPSGEQWHTHRPHPGKEAKRYQVRDIRELLARIGVTP
jgi:HicA toxin of bacterial toxin-antitoxin,